MAISLSGCKGNAPPFPANQVFIVDPKTQYCSQHNIISKNPLKVDKGIVIDWNDCPGVFGFQSSDTPAVFSWIRKMEKLANERCK
jgi:hypothetical protein